MATRPVRFSAVPAIPQAGINPYEFAALTALKENVEILIGARGATATAGKAVTKGQIGVNPAPEQNMKQITAEGAGYTVSGVTVPSIDDYAKLLTNVQTLANDVANLRATVNALINQLKA
jgi:hypothetical protein